MAIKKLKGRRRESLPFILLPKIKSARQAQAKIEELNKIKSTISEEIELLRIAVSKLSKI